jgi:hypothetical protein
MTIKTHEDLRAAARKAITLWQQLPEHQFACMKEWSEETVGRTESCWHDLCRTLDRVVYAAGGHRDHLTWHLFGACLTAEDLWGPADLPSFLVKGLPRSAHQQLALTAFWANHQPLVAKPKSRKGLSLPAIEGRTTEAELENDEAARQLAIERFAAFKAAREKYAKKAAR